MVGNTEEKGAFPSAKVLSSKSTCHVHSFASESSCRLAPSSDGRRRRSSRRLLVRTRTAQGPHARRNRQGGAGRLRRERSGRLRGRFALRRLPGIRTELYVRAKGSYTRVSHYEGKDGSFEEAGVWRVEFAPDAQTIEGATVIFEPVLSDDPGWKAVPQGPALRLLDREGKPVEGALAEHYVLRKN